MQKRRLCRACGKKMTMASNYKQRCKSRHCPLFGEEKVDIECITEPDQGFKVDKIWSMDG